MAKRPRTVAQFQRDLDRLTEKLGKRRNEIRKLEEDARVLLESIEEGDGELFDAVHHLQQAKDSIGRGADALSQYA